MEELTEEQINFLNKVCKRKWKQTEKGIYVNGCVNIFFVGLKIIPVKFYKVEGYFDCSYNYLTSLEGCPEYVEGSFSCSHNYLTSLKGCPEYVEGNFHCCANKLISLEGIGEVKGMIYCLYGNNINYKKEKENRSEIYKKIYGLSFFEKMIAES